MKSDFHARKAARIDRYQELSEKAKRRQAQLVEESDRLVEHIPFGQPILVGHHSERAHRRTLERSQNKMFQSLDEGKKARYYEDKADAAASNHAISSDDPDAIEKLKKKIAEAETAQAHMKAVNRIVKAKKKTNAQKIEELQAMGYTLDQADALLLADFCGRTGFPDYRLTNNNANIRRMKHRLEQLEKAETQETTEQEINGVTICDNVEDNRVQIFFPDMPSETIRAFLKSHGFHWSKYIGAWMRQRSSYALQLAKEAAQKYTNEQEQTDRR